MSNNHDNDSVDVKPFLKWVGGKSQLIDIIESKFPKEFNRDMNKNKIEKYFEPFVGGGALFFHILSNYPIEESYISDTNEDLILTYNVIKRNPDKLIDSLYGLKSKYIDKNHEERKTEYEKIRSEFNGAKNRLSYKIDYKKYPNIYIQQAARLIFLNKTCFNGIYRVNSKGHFNVPMGRYKNPSIYDEENIYAISDKIQETTIVNESYGYWKDKITPNSLVYLDPPYRPITETSFTSYTKSNFNDKNQEDLAQFFKDISKLGAKVILSNSDPHNKDKKDMFFDNLYYGFNVERVFARRYVNCDGSNRGPITEILVRNYPREKVFDSLL